MIEDVGSGQRPFSMLSKSEKPPARTASVGAIQSEAASTKEAREFDTAARGMCAVAKKRLLPDPSAPRLEGG